MPSSANPRSRYVPGSLKRAVVTALPSTAAALGGSNVTFPAPGDYSFRILVNGSERKRLPLLIAAPDA